MATKKTTTRKKTTRKTTTASAKAGTKTGTKSRTKKAATRKAAPKDDEAPAPRASRSPAKRGAKHTSPDPRYPNMARVEREIGGRTLSLETGRMAKLADGAIVARYGDTMVLATAQCASSDRDDIDFFPLTVDYREKAAAAGKFPGGFFKREGRPTTREILTCRIIDRSIRPLFADGFKRETQVLTQVLATDKENDSDILAAVAGFAALAISSIPNGKTLGAVRIGLVDGKLKINPTWTETRSEDNKLNLTVSAHRDAIVMVEAGADQLSEEVVLRALELAHEVCCDIAEMIDELVDMVGKPKLTFTPPAFDEKLAKAIDKKFGKDLASAPVSEGDKFARGAAKDAVKKAVKEAFPVPAGATSAEAMVHQKTVSAAIEKGFKQGERSSILAGRRADGRGTTDIRPITIDVGVLPRVHGSALFTRGETQALCVATLGTVDDQQFIDGIYPEDKRRWLLHYSFPPFSVGEVRRMLAPGRREIGHGALAERAVEAMLPGREEFPYTLRVTSEILESNGSSSMATVCGATLSLMDAGVPIKQPVAGIAMGLVVEGDDVAILSDILGSEDHCGDMDFKVTGTGSGITALQMDIKCEGLSRETLQEALEQARQGRLHILREMLKTIRRPREAVSAHAPKLVSFPIPADKIGTVIGPGGRTIRGMQEEFDCRIAVIETGKVEVCGADSAKVDACIARIQDMTAEVEMGKVYKGRVTGLKEFGAFVEILPGQEGLVHVSELSNEFIRSVTDVVKVGDELEVKVIDIDDFGKVKLSRKALMGPSPEGADGGSGRRERGDRDDRGDRGDRRDRGERRDRPFREERGDRGDRRDRGERRPRRDVDGIEDAPVRFDDEDAGEPRRERGGREDREERRPRRDRGERRPRRDEFEDEAPRGRDRDDDRDEPAAERPRREDREERRPRRDRGERRPRRDEFDDEPRREPRAEADDRYGRPARTERDDRPRREDRDDRGSRRDRPARGGDERRGSRRDDERPARPAPRDDEFGWDDEPARRDDAPRGGDDDGDRRPRRRRRR